MSAGLLQLHGLWHVVLHAAAGHPAGEGLLGGESAAAGLRAAATALEAAVPAGRCILPLRGATTRGGWLT